MPPFMITSSNFNQIAILLKSSFSISYNQSSVISVGGFLVVKVKVITINLQF